jgi:hypothetical protein
VKTIKQLTKNQLIAVISQEVAKTGDNHEVFGVTQHVLGEYRMQQSAALAKLVYKASRVTRKPARVKALAKGFAVLAKRRDDVLEAINTARAVFGYSKYALTELGVWSCRMETGITGAPVWQSVDTLADLMAILRHDQKQMDLLLAWGRVQAHGDEGRAAAALITKDMLKAWEQSMLAIGNAVAKQGKETVPFKAGVAMQWAVDGYDAATTGIGKDGAVLRGVSDAIRAAINGAFFAERNATNRERYALSGVVSGQRTAYHAINPREGSDIAWQEGQRQELRVDQNTGQEDYAGAESVIIEIGTRTINLGSNPGASDIHEAFMAYDEYHKAKAEGLLADAALVMGQLTCGIRFEDVMFDNFEGLKEAIYTSLAARSTARREAAEQAKELQQAKLVIQVSSTMDAVSRRMFIATQKHLPLDAARDLLREEALAHKARQEKAMAKALAEIAAAEELMVREAAYAATETRAQERERTAAARKAKAKADALANSKLDRELWSKPQEVGYQFSPVDREIPSVAHYRQLLTEKKELSV